MTVSETEPEKHCVVELQNMGMIDLNWRVRRDLLDKVISRPKPGR